MQIRVHFNNSQVECTLPKKYKLKMIISARPTIFILQENLLVKFSRQYHTPMKITFPLWGGHTGNKSNPLTLPV